MSNILRKRGLGKIKVIQRRQALKELEELGQINDTDVKVSLIQALIPVGLKEVGDLLQEEVNRLAGIPKKHDKVNTRWGSQGGSVYLLDQKVPISVPRVRNKSANAEVPLKAYHKLQEPHKADEGLFLKLLNGLSTHKYAESAELSSQVFGISASNVSKRFRKWSAAYLEKLQTRKLEGYDFIAIFIDGKAYAKDGIVIAMGITIEGRKIMLGLEQMNAENAKSVVQFFNKLIERGLSYEQGLLFIVDGSKGLIKAIEERFKDEAVIQRCQQHKKKNVESYLPLGMQKAIRLRLSQAYDQETYVQAKAALLNIALELDKINPSAAASLKEGLEETLTLHRLGLHKELSRSFTSTNCIESVMSQIGQFTDKVDRWRNGRHIQEWVASGLIQIEPKLNKVSSWRYLKLLREKIQKMIQSRTIKQTVDEPVLIAVGA